MMPRNPLKFESWKVIDNLVPPRMVGSEFTSFTAASIAIFETLPLMVPNVHIAPTFTTAGLEAPSVEPGMQIMSIETTQTRFIVILFWAPPQVSYIQRKWMNGTTKFNFKVITFYVKVNYKKLKTQAVAFSTRSKTAPPHHSESIKKEKYQLEVQTNRTKRNKLSKLWAVLLETQRQQTENWANQKHKSVSLKQHLGHIRNAHEAHLMKKVKTQVVSVCLKESTLTSELK